MTTKLHKPKKSKASTIPMVAGGALGMIEHPKIDRTSARRTLARHAQHFKNGSMSEADFEDKIKHHSENMMGY